MKVPLLRTPVHARGRLCAVELCDARAGRRASSIDELADVAARYAVAITPAMAELIDPGDPDDPIARQFVPDARELEQRPEERADPIGDDAHSPVEGIVHRYPDRVLLKARQRLRGLLPVLLPPRDGRAGAGRAVAARRSRRRSPISAREPQIWEVILTGGDPLVLSARRLADVVARLAAIDHVKVVRVHTRVPVVAPERVSAPRWCARCGRADKATFVVLHANHPRELTAKRPAPPARGLVDAGIPMLSQSVLLRGVNDDAETLGALMRALVECRIKPYYLHHADLAPGTAHLRTDDCRRPGADARAARPLFGPVPADLCARHPRRPRQIADRPELSERRTAADRRRF